MKKLSLWAKLHPWQARFIIALIHIALGFSMFYGGFWWLAEGHRLPDFSYPLLCGIFLAALLAYPFQEAVSGFFRHSYARQKSLDFAIGVSGLLLIFFAGNELTQRLLKDETNAAFPQQIVLRKDQSFGTWQEKNFNTNQLHNEKGKFAGKTRFQTLKHWWQDVKSAVRGHAGELKKSKLEWWQVGLVALAILLAITTMIFVAALSCNVSCNGNEAAGTIIFFGGLALILFGYVMAMRVIFKPTGNQRKGIWVGLAALVVTTLALILINTAAQ